MPISAWLYFDESGPFESDATLPWVIVARGGRGATPVAQAFHAGWAQAWAHPDLEVPDWRTFHATDFDDRRRSHDAACRLAADASVPGDFLGWYGAAQVPGARAVDYVEAVVGVVVRAAATLLAGAPNEPRRLEFTLAHRVPLNLPALSRLIHERLKAVLRESDGVAPSLSVIPYVSHVNREPALVISDLLCCTTWRAVRDGQQPPVAVTLIPPKPLRLAQADLDRILGRAQAILEEARPVAPPLALPVAPPLALPLAPPAPLSPQARLHQAIALLVEADLAIESKRDERPSFAARDAAEALLADQDWCTAVDPLDVDELDLRLSLLEQAIGNHAGVVAAEVGERADLPRSRRLMNAHRAGDAVLLYENRCIIALTNAYRFQEARKHAETMVAWLRGLAGPFGGGGGAQLGPFLGTLGQCIALDASARQDASALEQADRCFVEALGLFDAPGDRQRQHTYRLQVVAERVRLNVLSPEDAWAAAESIDGAGSNDALARAEAGTFELGDVFRLHVLHKLAALTGRVYAASTTKRLVSTMKAYHPWASLALWFDRSAAADPEWRYSGVRTGMVVSTGRLVAGDSLLAWTVRLQLLDSVWAGGRGVANLPTVDKLASLVPEAILAGWEQQGFAARLAAGWGAVGAPSNLLPFNFC